MPVARRLGGRAAELGAPENKARRAGVRRPPPRVLAVRGRGRFAGPLVPTAAGFGAPPAAPGTRDPEPVPGGR